jgi:hypothetical protein
MGGKRNIPRTAFPLLRGYGYQLGTKWNWRVDELDAGGQHCRLLTAFDTTKQGFMAMLTVQRGQDFIIVATYEYHADHPGWHVHSSCGDAASIPVSTSRPYGAVRIPAVRARHRRLEYDVTESTALAISYRAFSVEAEKGELI